MRAEQWVILYKRSWGDTWTIKTRLNGHIWIFDSEVGAKAVAQNMIRTNQAVSARWVRRR